MIRLEDITVSTKVNRLKTRRNTQLVVLRGSHQSHIALRRISLTAIAGKVIIKALACYSIKRAIRKTWCCWIIFRGSRGDALYLVKDGHVLYRGTVDIEG